MKLTMMQYKSDSIQKLTPASTAATAANVPNLTKQNLYRLNSFNQQQQQSSSLGVKMSQSSGNIAAQLQNATAAAANDQQQKQICLIGNEGEKEIISEQMQQQLSEQEKSKNQSIKKQEMIRKSLYTHDKPQKRDSKKRRKSGQAIKRKVDIHQFQRLAVMGEGAFGKVYRVLWHHNQKHYALKRISKQLLVRQGKKEWAIVEKSTMLYLNHPNIVKLYEAFQDHKYFYLVMQLVPNGTLADFYDRRPFTPQMTKFYSAQLVALVEYLFKMNIAHRDLKPENLLLDENYHLKLTDFATSKRVDQLKSKTMASKPEGQEEDNSSEIRKGTFVGTREQALITFWVDILYRYVAPQVINQEVSGFAADLWSLGCIIYKLICGKTPFQADNQYLIYEKIRNVQLNFTKHFDEKSKDIITKLLQLNPELRIGMSKDDFTKTAIHHIKDHPFFEGIDFDKIFDTKAPINVPNFKRTQLNIRKQSQYSQFSTPGTKARTQDASSTTSTTHYHNKLASIAKLLDHQTDQNYFFNEQQQKVGYFFSEKQQQEKQRFIVGTHMSIDHIVKDFAIYDNSMNAIESISSHKQQQQQKIKRSTRSSSKFFQPVQMFARKEQHAETIIKTGLLYRLDGKKKKTKQIVSITNEPRILIYNPSNNKFQEDIPLTKNLSISQNKQNELLISTTYGKSYRFKDNSQLAMNGWQQMINYAINKYNLSKLQ